MAFYGPWWNLHLSHITNDYYANTEMENFSESKNIWLNYIKSCVTYCHCYSRIFCENVARWGVVKLDIASHRSEVPTYMKCQNRLSLMEIYYCTCCKWTGSLVMKWEYVCWQSYVPIPQKMSLGICVVRERVTRTCVVCKRLGTQLSVNFLYFSPFL